MPSIVILNRSETRPDIGAGDRIQRAAFLPARAVPQASSARLRRARSALLIVLAGTCAQIVLALVWPLALVRRIGKEVLVVVLGMNATLGECTQWRRLPACVLSTVDRKPGCD